MYYILNETNQIIAADDNLLELCGLSHIDELSLKIALGDTKFDLSEENIIITNNNSDKTFSMSKTSLSSMLGHLTLVEIQVEKEKTKEDDLSVLTLDDTIESIATLDLDSDLISIKSDIEDISEETEVALDDNELFDLALEDEADEIIETQKETHDILTEDTDIFDLGLSDEKDIVLSDTPVSDDQSEILIDIEKVSQQIGVSHEDYDTFLDEYIDTALGLEQDLQSADTAKRSNAVATLSHLGEVLQLPVIGAIIAKVDTASASKQKETVESFYAALSRITTSQTSQEEAKIDLFDAEAPVEEKTEPEVTVNEKSFGTISLEGIKPIHFDFQLEAAANDLSLPVELIEEFVHDFIEQGHIETEKMLKAYEEGDLDAIQKIGHLLKGASSNLRINALSDTLYKIQFCENSNDLEHFIKDYWGHFLSLEIQINALAK
jgi:hypothetical protein